MIASATNTIGLLVTIAATLGWLTYWFFFNRPAGHAEVGSEIELAANRRKYHDDEELEGGRLERTQMFGVLLLAVLVIGLPVYWVLEPSRQAGAVVSFDKKLAGWGEGLFATTANGGFNCAGCHGAKGGGGVAPYALTEPTTGEVKSVSWTAPAVNTVLYRFSEDEVRFILVYGRPFSPMSPWGVDGGGPLNAQQIDSLIAYLASIQISREECVKQGRGSAHLRGWPPARCEPGRHPGRGRASGGRGYGRVGGRGAVQPQPRQRRLLVRPVPHQGLELRRPAGHRWRSHGPQPHGRVHGASVPERAGHGRLPEERLRARQEVRPAVVRAAARCPPSATC